MDLMIDIETLATTPDAVILTIGAVEFNPFSDDIGDTLYSRLDVEQGNRVIEDNTIEWWGKQDKHLQEEAFSDGDRIQLEDSLKKLTKMVVKNNRVWANGISFDIPILENAYRSYGMHPPWNFWDVLDTRTIYKINPNKSKLGNSHNALEDCVNQIVLLQESLKSLNVTKI